MPRPKTTIAGPPFAHSFLPLQGDEIRHEGQPIAMVLGETLEAAEAGARKVDVRYAPTTAKTPVAPLWSELDRAARGSKNTGYFFFEPEFSKGNADQNLALAKEAGRGRLFAAVAPSQSDGALRGPCVVGGRCAHALCFHAACLWRADGIGGALRDPP